MQVVQRDEVSEGAVPAVTEHSRLQLSDIVHLKTTDKTYLHAESTMLASALKANVDTVIDGDPLRPDGSTLETMIVLHVAHSHAFHRVEDHMA